MKFDKKAPSALAGHDPKLKEAMAEIFSILNKFDIAGAFTIVSPTHAEFRMKIDPSWSCAYFEASDCVRFRAKKLDFKSKAEHMRVLDASVHMINMISRCSFHHAQNASAMFLQLKEVLPIEEFPSHFEAHVEDA